VVCPGRSKQLTPEQTRAPTRNIPDDGMRMDFHPFLGIGKPSCLPYIIFVIDGIGLDAR
jgi:hypothetical protein